jgi:hypothetical protein
LKDIKCDRCFREVDGLYEIKYEDSTKFEKRYIKKEYCYECFIPFIEILEGEWQR